MLTSKEYSYMTAAELSRRIKNKELSPVEVMEACIKRIEERNDSLNAFVYTDFENARRLAKEAEQKVLKGEAGLLTGVPTAIKDLFDFYPNWPNTSGGIRCLKDRLATNFNIYTERMVSQGAIPVGKTNSPTMGFRGTCDNYLFGATKNPFGLSKNSGGSSGGAAAAVADGMIPLAEGTDGGGSIRIPAAWCGLFGFKPAAGTVPFICRPNAFGAINPFFFEGALTRTVEDCALSMNVIAGYHEKDPFSIDWKRDYMTCMEGSLKGVKIAFTPDFGVFPVEDDIRNSVQQATSVFKDMGASVEEVNFNIKRTHLELSDVWCRLIVMSAIESVEALRKEGIDLMGEFNEDLPPELSEWIKIGYKTTLKEYLEDQIIRSEIYDALQDVLHDYDYIISPTLCCNPVENTGDGNTTGPRELLGQPIDPLIGWCMTYFTNFSGHPTASLPSGLSTGGYPIGMQIIGRRFDDIGVLRASAQFEKSKPWHDIYNLADGRPL